MKRFAANYLMVRDEFCLKHSCESLVRQKVRDFFFFVPKTYWDGTPVTQEEVKSVEVVAEYLKKRGVNVRIHRVDVELNEPGKYGLAEASIRNRSLDIMGAKGFEHVILIDSDELMRKDAIRRMNSYLNSHREARVLDVESLPIAGFPGYPVDGPSEGLVMYVHASVRFQFSRTPTVKHYRVPHTRPSVYHFTSTRRSMEDTIHKHLKSCHYKESGYDFDKWLKETLPNIKPGVPIRHMFEKWQIWDRVRPFSVREWNEIPKDLKPYLGGLR